MLCFLPVEFVLGRAATSVEISQHPNSQSVRLPPGAINPGAPADSSSSPIAARNPPTSGAGPIESAEGMYTHTHSLERVFLFCFLLSPATAALTTEQLLLFFSVPETCTREHVHMTRIALLVSLAAVAVDVSYTAQIARRSLSYPKVVWMKAYY